MQDRPVEGAQGLVHVVPVLVLHHSDLMRLSVSGRSRTREDENGAHLPASIIEHIREHRKPGTARKVLEVLPACVVVEPLHVYAIHSRRPRSAARRGSAFALAPTKLDAQAGPVEVVPVQINYKYIWHPSQLDYKRSQPNSILFQGPIHKSNNSGVFSPSRPTQPFHP